MKKIILVGIMFMMCMGVVSASSKNGDFEGNPIVKLLNGGQLVSPDDVPAIIYKGRTMIPIALLRKMGAGVVWDQENYAVNINLPDADPVTKYIDITLDKKKKLETAFIAEQYYDFTNQIRWYTDKLMQFAIQVATDNVVFTQTSIKQYADYIRKHLDTENLNLENNKNYISKEDYDQLNKIMTDCEGIFQTFKNSLDYMIEGDNFRKTDFNRSKNAITSGTTSVDDIQNKAYAINNKAFDLYFSNFKEVMK